MSQKSEDLLTVLDAGSSKIRVLVAELHEGALRYRAHSVMNAEGMRKGLISDLQPASRVFNLAATEAETVGDPALAFWSEVGIDPIRIISDLGDHYTLRCYLDDAPVFLGSGGRIDVFSSPRALVRYLTEHPQGHDLDAVSTWPQVTKRAQDRELVVAVDNGNTYVLAGLTDDLAGGPETVDPGQLELAVELITDAERWAGSDAADKALASSEPLGWLVSFLVRPDPTRLAPSAPFDAEAASWRNLVGGFEDRLQVH